MSNAEKDIGGQGDLNINKEKGILKVNRKELKYESRHAHCGGLTQQVTYSSSWILVDTSSIILSSIKAFSSAH